MKRILRWDENRHKIIMTLCKSLHEQEITHYHCLLYYDYFQSANPLGQVFFVTFVFVVFFGLMSMFVTIICEAFAVIKEDAQEATNDYEVCMVYYSHGIYYSIVFMSFHHSCKILIYCDKCGQLCTVRKILIEDWICLVQIYFYCFMFTFLGTPFLIG